MRRFPATLLLMGACGGGGQPASPAEDASTPVADAGSGDCVRGVECDVELPAPDRGFQIRVGPFDVPPGSEVFRCYWRKVPVDIDVVKIDLAYNRGSHHIDIFTTDYPMPDGEFDCSRPEEWANWPSQVERGLPEEAGFPRIVVGFQNESIEWSLPDGVAYRLRKGQQLLLQSHYVNAATQLTPSARGLDIFNLHAAGGPVRELAETLFDEDSELRLPPLSTYERVRYCEFPEPVRLIGMFGHFHSRGIRHRVFAWDPVSRTDVRMLYESTAWDSPPWLSQAAWGGPLEVRAIRIVGEYQNRENREIRWGFEVNQNEHLETYAMFYPRLDVLGGCVCYHDGERPEHIQHGRAELCMR